MAATLLPDILPFDHTRPASYPENGRALTDDVQDYFPAILTNGRVTTDGVGPHGDLLADIPLPRAAARRRAPRHLDDARNASGPATPQAMTGEVI